MPFKNSILLRLGSWYVLVAILIFLSLFVSNSIIRSSQLTPITNEISVEVHTLATTSYSIEDLEIIEHNGRCDIFICESKQAEELSKISHISEDEPLTTIFISNIRFHQLALIELEDIPESHLVVGHDQGLTLLSQEFGGGWSNYSLSEFGYHHPWELITGEIDPSLPNEEFLLIYEGALLDFAFFQMFSYNDTWTSRIIYSENPVTRAAYVGEFNTSHQGKELICVNEGGYITLLKKMEGKWLGTQLWDFGNVLLNAVVGADFDTSIPGDEFAVGCVNASHQFIAIFSMKKGTWIPEIIPLEGVSQINDIVVGNMIGSPVPEIITVDDEGNVWWIRLKEDQWEIQKLWEEKDSLKVVRTLNDSTVIVGGNSKKLTEIMLKEPTSTSTTTRSKTTSWNFSFNGTVVLIIILLLKTRKIPIS